ncbi:MAG: hypothetical protein GOV01_00520 [Candidatus Altiarchaeota archaeon]|nr:hypothetical protein [Candidatus Altiarchaeota archaeon]
MDIKRVSKATGMLEFQLIGEDHTLANLIRELSWSNGAEATYKINHPLLGNPIVKIISKNPKTALQKVSKNIVKLSKDVEKAFS